MRAPGVAALAVLLLTAAAAPQEPPAPAPAPPPADRALPLHPGGIAWERDLDAAKAAAAKDGKPVVAYFTFDT